MSTQPKTFKQFKTSRFVIGFNESVSVKVHWIAEPGIMYVIELKCPLQIIKKYILNNQD